MCSVYDLLSPPGGSFDVTRMSKKELVEYGKWFLAVIPDRIAQLTMMVRSTRGFEGWNPDESPASLDTLGTWFAHQVETRPRTVEEMAEMRKGLKFDVDIDPTVITDLTISFAYDIGMYLGQVFIQNNDGISWTQKLRLTKTSIDNGQPILVGFGKLSCNPVRIALVIAMRIAENKGNGNSLREAYENWVTHVPSN